MHADILWGMTCVCVKPIQVYSKCMRVSWSLSADMLSLWLTKLLLSLLNCFTAHWSPPAATAALPVSAICLWLAPCERDKTKATFHLVHWHFKTWGLGAQVKVKITSGKRLCWIWNNSCMHGSCLAVASKHLKPAEAFPTAATQTRVWMQTPEYVWIPFEYLYALRKAS